MKYIGLALIAVGLIYAGLHWSPRVVREIPTDRTDTVTSTPGTVIRDVPPQATSTDQTLMVVDLLASADRYNGQRICVKGYYETTFEFSALAYRWHLDDKERKHIDKPYIWVGTEVPRSQLQCLEPGQGLYCFGEVTICGLFEVAPEGQKGFGQLGLYRYQLGQ